MNPFFLSWTLSLSHITMFSASLNSLKSTEIKKLEKKGKKGRGRKTNKGFSNHFGINVTVQAFYACKKKKKENLKKKKCISCLENDLGQKSNIFQG